MDIDKIKNFLAVVQCKSIAKAAKNLYLSPTAVSQQMVHIEEEIGVMLFKRTANRLEITPAGKIFYEDCVRIISLYDEALIRTKKIAAQNNPHLFRIGINVENEFFLPFLEILDQLKLEFPQMQFEVKNGTFLDLAKYIDKEVIDCALTYRDDILQMDSIAYSILAEWQLGLLVPDNHPFASLSSVMPYQLADINLGMIAEHVGPVNYTRMIESSLNDGYQPRITELADNINSLLMMVDLGICAAIVPAYTATGCKRARFLQIENTHHKVEYVIAWNKKASTRKQEILKTIEKLIKEKTEYYETIHTN